MSHGKLELLFDASLIPQELAESFGPHYGIRPLALDDHKRGYFSLLSDLTSAPEQTAQDFESQFKKLQSCPDTYYILVVHPASDPNTLLANGSLILERKFLRGLGTVGHVEDIVVSKKLQGSGLGKRLISVLTGLSEALGCYKTILDCDLKNTAFYEKCGYSNKGAQMAKYA